MCRAYISRQQELMALLKQGEFIFAEIYILIRRSQIY